MSEEKKTKDLLDHAFRYKQNIAERIICQHLFLASSTTKPSQIINHSCVATMLEEGLHPEVEGLDFELMKRIYLINQCFENVIKERIHQYQYVFSVEWAFDKTEENYNLYIKPWNVPFSFINSTDLMKHFGLNYSNLINLPKWKKFFEYSGVLAVQGYKKLQSAFYNWAIFPCQKRIAVMSGLVSPQTFENVSKLMMGAQNQEQETKVKFNE